MKPSPLLLAGALLLAAPVVAAQPAGFEAVYSKGVKLENAGSVVDALAAFESIPVDKRDFNTRLHIGGCKQKLNRFLAAEAEYEAIRTDPKADPATIETAMSELQDLRTRVPIIKLSTTASNSDLRVTLDGQVVAGTGEHRVDPGPHRIEATRGTTVVFERTTVLAESSSVTVAIDAPVSAVSASSASPANPTSLAETPRHNTRLTGLPFYIGGGIALLGGGVAYLVSKSAEEDVKNQCAAQLAVECDEERAGAPRVRTWQTIGFTAAGLGVAAIGIGIVIDATRKHPTSTSLTVGIRPIAAGTTLQIAGSF